MVKKLTKAEKIAKMPIEQIAKLHGESGRNQLINYVRTLRTGYKRRVSQFKRSGLVSHAQITLENSLPRKRREFQLTKLTRNQLILEFVRYQKFFNSKTSTVKGIKEVDKVQDLRIFGEGFKKGTPAGKMTSDERIRYWSAYDEFINQYGSLISIYGSERVQQILASQISLDTSGNILEVINNTKYLLQIFSDLATEPEEGDSPNVYAGRGPFEPA